MAWRDWDGHLVLAHHSEQERRSAVAAWARDGLRAGAKLIYVEPPGERPARSVRGILDAYDVDAHAALAQGQFQVLAPDGALYSAAGQRRLLERAHAEGYASLWISAEATTAHDVVTPYVHFAAERGMDELCRREPVSALCQYPGSLPRARWSSMVSTHAAGVRTAELRLGRKDGVLVLAGEVDVAGAAALRSFLWTATRELAPGVLRLDLTELAFLDVSGARALLEATAEYRERGGLLDLRGGGRSVRRVLALFGRELTPGVEVDSA